MNFYIEEKKLFSGLQSNSHKLLNTLKKNKIVNNSNNFQQLLEINNLIDILNSKIINLNENINIEPNRKGNLNIIKTINNDNKAIKDIIPILFMYRLLLNP
jgi:hypothetical protein